MEVRRTRRITRNQVLSAFEQAIKEGQISSQQGLMLLRCSGSILAEEKTGDRLKLSQDFWKKLPELGVKYDVTHYNALLKTYLENEHSFKVPDILAEMEANQTLPNRVTYQRFIACYCQQGDIQGASQILEHMKDQQLAINEAVFCSLIEGHMKANEEDKAENILNVMRQAEMEPSNDAFASLIQGYAERGNVEGVRKGFQLATDSYVSLSPQNIFDTVCTLANAGHEEYIPEVLEKLNATSGFNQDAINCVHQLITNNHDDVAYQVFETMPKPVMDNIDRPVFGRFLIRALIKHERPVEKVVSTLSNMHAKNYNTDGLTGAAYLSLQMGKTDYAVKLFRELQKTGIATRTHYFWPLVQNHKNAGNAEGVYDCMSTMREMSNSQADFVLTLHTYAIPALEELGEPLDRIETRLKEVGFSAEEVNFSVFLSLSGRGKFKEALEYVEGKPVAFFPFAVRPAITLSMKSTGDTESMLKILDLAKNEWCTSGAENAQLNSDILNTYIYNHFSSQQTMDLVTGMKEKGMCISKDCASDIERYISSVWKRQNVKEEFLQALQKLDICDEVISSVQGIELSDKTTEELEQLLNEASRRNESTRGIQKWLLYKYCSQGNVQDAEALMEQLANQGFVYTGDSLRQIWYLVAAHKKDLKEALKYKELLESQNPKFYAYTAPLLTTAGLLIKEGNVEDAMAMIEDYANKHADYMKERQFQENYLTQGGCSSLIQACNETGNMDLSLQMLEKLFDLGYIKRGSFKLLEEYMRGVVASNDGDKMISALHLMSDKYERVPVFEDIFKHLIEKEDPENLQKAMDLVTQQHGEMNVLHHLLIGFLECGKVKQARKILETPGLRAIMPRLLHAADRCIKENKIKELETLVQETKGMFAIDRDEMLFQLIKAYGRQKDWKKALEVHTMYEDEDVVPSGRTLRYLANVLKSSDQEVPFAVPSPAESGIGTNFSSKNAEEKRAFGFAEQGNIKQAMEIKQRVESSGGRFSENFISDLGELLLKKTNKSGFHKLCDFLGDSGDVDTLLLLKSIDKSPGGVLHHNLFRAYINGNRADEIVSFLEESPKDVPQFVSRSGLMALNKKNPELLIKVEQLICSNVTETENYRTANTLWSHYAISDQYDKATGVLQRIPGLLKYLRVSPVCIHAKQSNNLELFNQVLETVRHENPNSLAFTYSYLIGTHCFKKDVNSALSAFNQAKEAGIQVSQLQTQSRSMLSTLLQDNNIEIPWKPEDVQEPQSDDTSSSSESNSSSSSSDEEVSK